MSSRVLAVLWHCSVKQLVINTAAHYSWQGIATQCLTLKMLSLFRQHCYLDLGCQIAFKMSFWILFWYFCYYGPLFSFKVKNCGTDVPWCDSMLSLRQRRHWISLSRGHRSTCGWAPPTLQAKVYGEWQSTGSSRCLSPSSITTA